MKKKVDSVANICSCTVNSKHPAISKADILPFRALSNGGESIRELFNCAHCARCLFCFSLSFTCVLYEYLVRSNPNIEVKPEQNLIC